jgi:hypothetical protein
MSGTDQIEPADPSLAGIERRCLSGDQFPKGPDDFLRTVRLR